MTTSAPTSLLDRIRPPLPPVASPWLGTGLAMALAIFLVPFVSAGDAAIPSGIWDRSNLVAWCIVPFDPQKRTPAERVQMLSELGLRRFAYDFRPEHLPTFENEIELLQESKIELTAVWFPMRLNDDAKLILALLEKHRIRTQLWVMGAGSLGMSSVEEAAFIETEAERIRPIAEAAQRIGCQVALYNHGNWFGEPENQLKLIQRLQMPNVGIVYNLHHAHHQLDRLPEILKSILPHLLALNLNGMRSDGDRIGHKILPIGEGDRDLEVIRCIEASGYRGPIGILNHTNEDARHRLQDNLDGLAWCLRRMKSNAVEAKPTWRSYRGAAVFQPALLTQIVKDVQAEGNASKGLKLFASESTACLSCHAIGRQGGKVGPELTAIGTKRTPEQLVTSLLWPHREIEPAYQTYQYLLDDGRVLRGFRVTEEKDSIVLREPASGLETKFARSAIEEEKSTGSVMPETLVASLPRNQQLDLMAFVSSLGQPDGLQPAIVESLLEHARSHKAIEFPYDKGPMVPAHHPWFEAHVNRDRVYDFYAKQAEHFRTKDREAMLLAEYPGLDGREFGHWGNQNEETWAGSEWNAMQLGPFQCQVFKNGSQTIPRGVCVRLMGAPPTAPASACFNMETLQFEAFWKGGFVDFSTARHGFLDGARPVGKMEPAPPKVKHEGVPSYRGFYRYRGHTIFAYRLGDVEYLDSVSIVDGRWVRTRMPADQHPLNACLEGGPAEETDQLETSIESSDSQPYAIDTIELPVTNRWKAPLFGGDLDFLSDGSLYFATMHGDVWHVSGFTDATSRKARWRRFATGLHHALGLVVHQDQCYVLGRNQITRLHDLNGDGEADWYECFSKAMETSPAGHDFICGLQRDEHGNFYTASGNQGLLKIRPDGQQAEVIATGFRNPDGLGLLPNGSLTIPCSEGDWTPTSMICLRKPSQRGIPFYGYRGPQVGGRPELPILYLPRGLDNSSGGQAYVSSDRWGLFKGGLIHFSFGTGTAMHVMLDEVDGQSQAAARVIPVEFRSGAHRGRFSPTDGQLYVAGMGGWGSYTPDAGCLQRLRYTGEDSPTPIGFRAHENGVAIRFSAPLSGSDSTASRWRDPGQYFVQAWNYRYSPNYGSAEYSTIHTGVRGHDRLAIQSIQLLDDETTLFLEIPDIQPVNQLQVYGSIPHQPAIDLYATIHRLAPARSDIQGFRPIAKKLAPHPIEFDLASASKRKPNPWRKKVKDSREIRLEAGQNLSFATGEIRVQRNEKLAITFRNPDVVPHNWALLKPGSLSRVGELVNRMISDPDAAFLQYIPVTEDVICYTDIIDPNDQGTIYFNAPSQPGRYPYICSFPGHWMVMNGEMIVE